VLEANGKLLLRLTLGILMLFHGVAKVTGGIDGIAGMVAGTGLPGVLAYGVYIGEIVAPLMIIAGWYSRVGAAVLVVNMIVAVALVHPTQLFDLVERTGGYALELQAFYLLTAAVIMMIGPGRLSFNDK